MAHQAHTTFDGSNATTHDRADKILKKMQVNGIKNIQRVNQFDLLLTGYPSVWFQNLNVDQKANTYTIIQAFKAHFQHM